MTDIDYAALGVRIRHSRERVGLTQEQLGEICSLSAAHIGHIERGTRKMSVDTLLRISGALNVGADYLLMEPSPSDTDLLHSISAMIKGKDKDKISAFLKAVKILAENIDKL